MNVRPLNEKVIVRPVAAAKESAGGVILSVRPQSEPDQGVVVWSHFGSSVLPGERVLYAQGRHPTTEIEGQQMVVLREDDLMAVVEA